MSLFIPSPARRAALFGMALLSLALAGVSPSALAHSDEYFDARPTVHGGRMRMAGPLHLELVVDGGEVRLYVTNHLDQARPSAGGEAAVRFPASDLRVSLTPSGDNLFSASAPAGLEADAEAVVFVKLPGMDAQSARFKARAAAVPAPADDDHAHHH